MIVKTQRQWIRVRLRLVIALRPPYGRLALGNGRGPSPRLQCRQLPPDLLQIVGEMMVKYPEIIDDTEARLHHNFRDKTERQLSGATLIGISQMPDQDDLRDYKRRLTDGLRHRNIRMVHETELVTICTGLICLFANVDQRWVAYRTTVASRSGCDLLYREIETAVSLRGNPYVSPLVGVVLESKTGVLKGLLVDLLSKGPTFRLMADHTSNNKPIPWLRRQKWAKQIVRAVAAFHEQGRFMGTLRDLLGFTICINDDDDVVILNAVQVAHPGQHAGRGLLPPEYRTENFTYGNGLVGPEFDIFQLGLVLWYLYRDQGYVRKGFFCTLSGCENAYRKSCAEHEDPIALPPAGAHVPPYLDHIITICRRWHPSERPAARELIEMFPSDEEISMQIDNINKGTDFGNHSEDPTTFRAHLKRVEVVRALYSDLHLCDVCGEECLKVTYTCENCELGSFDVCQACFSKGVHCDDSAHWLVRLPTSLPTQITSRAWKLCSSRALIPQDKGNGVQC